MYEFGKTGDRIRPYVLGGVGLYYVRLTAPGFSASSNTRLGFGGGAGVNYGVGAGGTRIFVEAKVTSVTVNGVQFASVPITAGVRFAGP